MEMHQIVTLAAAGITFILTLVCYRQYYQKRVPTLAAWGTAFLVYTVVAVSELLWEIQQYQYGVAAGLTLGLLLSGSIRIYSNQWKFHIGSALIALIIFVSMAVSARALIAISVFIPIVLMFIIFGAGFYKTRNKLIALMMVGLVLLTVAGELHRGYPELYRLVDACGYLVMLLALSGILK